MHLYHRHKKLIAFIIVTIIFTGNHRAARSNVLSPPAATTLTEKVKNSLDKTRVEIEPFKNEAETYYTPITREWNGHIFTVEIPEEYEEMAGPSTPGALIFAFAGAPREDGTRPMFQITLADLSILLDEEAGTMSLEEFGEIMIGGVERRREQWTVQVTDSQIGDLRVKRYAWTGIATLLDDRGVPVNTRMMGVMYVGIDANLGFTLHTQDLEQYAEEYFPIAEHSIGTFRLSIHKLSSLGEALQSGNLLRDELKVRENQRFRSLTP